jgi:hypothetical protein
MGFDPDKVPIVRQAFQCRDLPLAEHSWKEIVVVSNHAPWNRSLNSIEDRETFHFKPHFAWKGKVERTTSMPSVPASTAIAEVHEGQRSA